MSAKVKINEEEKPPIGKKIKRPTSSYVTK